MIVDTEIKWVKGIARSLNELNIATGSFFIFCCLADDFQCDYVAIFSCTKKPKEGPQGHLFEIRPLVPPYLEWKLKTKGGTTGPPIWNHTFGPPLPWLKIKKPKGGPQGPHLEIRPLVPPYLDWKIKNQGENHMAPIWKSGLWSPLTLTENEKTKGGPRGPHLKLHLLSPLTLSENKNPKGGPQVHLWKSGL